MDRTLEGFGIKAQQNTIPQGRVFQAEGGGLYACVAGTLFRHFRRMVESYPGSASRLHSFVIHGSIWKCGFGNPGLCGLMDDGVS